MSPTHLSRRRSSLIALALIASLAVTVLDAALVRACDGDVAGDGAASNDSSSGMRAYIDPATGELTSQPVVPELQPRGAAAAAATSTSTQGLVEQPAPGGGVMVDLQGRFQNEMRATIGADGAMHTDCVETEGAAEH